MTAGLQYKFSMELHVIMVLAFPVLVVCVIHGNVIPVLPDSGSGRHGAGNHGNDGRLVSPGLGNTTSVGQWITGGGRTSHTDTFAIGTGNAFNVIYTEVANGSDVRILQVRQKRSTSPPGTEIKIAALLPADEWRLFSIKRVAPAIDIAIEKVNPSLLRYNRSLVVKFRNSNCDIADGINEAINFYVQREVDVFFGPCCDYATATVARQTRYWDIPMVTAGALAGDFGLAKHSVFSALTRVGPNFNSVVNFIVNLLTFYNWKKMRLIYDPQGQMEVINKYCHIAANDIHYGFRTHSETHQFRHWYDKFERNDEILDNMGEFIGRDCAGRTRIHLHYRLH